MLTHERLLSVLHYDAATGVFTWRVNHPRSKGIAGSHGKDGEIIIKIDFVKYRANRLAWFYMNAGWPERQVDHVDGDVKNNVWSNLRLATNTENTRNRGCTKRNKTKMKGVTVHRNGFVAKIGINRKTIYLGKFATAEEAHEIYKKAAKKHFGDFARYA